LHIKSAKKTTFLASKPCHDKVNFASIYMCLH